MTMKCPYCGVFKDANHRCAGQVSAEQGRGLLSNLMPSEPFQSTPNTLARSGWVCHTCKKSHPVWVSSCEHTKD